MSYTDQYLGHIAQTQLLAISSQDHDTRHKANQVLIALLGRFPHLSPGKIQTALAGMAMGNVARYR